MLNSRRNKDFTLNTWYYSLRLRHFAEIQIIGNYILVILVSGPLTAVKFLEWTMMFRPIESNHKISEYIIIQYREESRQQEII
jgi:hypothetical protein